MLEFSDAQGRVRIFLLPERKQLKWSIDGADDDFKLEATVPLDADLTNEDGALNHVLSHVNGDHGHDLQRIKSVLLLARAASEGPKAERFLRALTRWLIASNEKTNFSYDLMVHNKRQAAHTVSLITGATFDHVQALFGEVDEAAHLTTHITEVLNAAPDVIRLAADARVHLGRRLIWYAIARLMKPSLIVETGVDQGLGSMILCEALLKNRAEGAPGRYIGTDIRPDAGAYLAGPYLEVGELMIGDSLKSLQQIGGPIDLFINDSDHSADYEAEEYQTVADKLSAHSVVLGDNAHSTSKLDQFALQTGRQFVFFREQPDGHWYPGAGVGVAWRPGKVGAAAR